MPTKAVTVTVTEDTTDVYQVVYTIRVSDEPVRLGSGDDGIEWTLDSADWSFTKDHHGDSSGVYVKRAGGKFNDKKGTRKKHKWERISTGGRYSYTISVTKNTNEDVVVTWDPTIMN